MESPTRLGLGIINIAPIRGRANLTTKVRVWSLGMGVGRCQTPNPTRSMDQFLVIMSYVLISLKAHSILLSMLTYTLAYIQQLTWHQSSQNPNIIYHDNSYQSQHTSIMHIISFHPRQPTNKILQGQKHRHGSIKELLESIKNIKNANIFQVHISYPNQMHIHMNACLTSLTLLHYSTYASMHNHIICMFMVETENLDWGFWVGVCMRIQRSAYTTQLYVYAYFKCVYACKKCAYACMQENPSLETRNRKNRAEPKTIKLTT